MKTLRLVAVNFKKILTSHGFYACVVLTIILCFSAEIYQDFTTMNRYSVINAFFTFDSTKLLSDTAFSSYSVMTKGTQGWLQLFAPIVSALAFVPLLCNEFESKAIRYSAFRCAKHSFNFGNFLTAFLSGGLAVLIGFIIFGVCVYFMFPNILMFPIDSRAFLEDWLLVLHPRFSVLGYPYLILLKLTEIFLFGAVSAIPAFVLTGFMRNKYLVICIPFFLKYGLTQTYIRLFTDAVSNENFNAIYLRILNFFNPDLTSYIFNYGNDTRLMFIIYGVLIVAAFFVYNIAMNRRLDYGE